MMPGMDTTTYKVRITFAPRRGKAREPYARAGLSWQAAMDLKTYFLERVPAATGGSMTPEE